MPLCPESLAALRRLDTAAEERGSVTLVPVGDPHAVSVAFRRTLGRARAQYLKDCKESGTSADAGFLIGVRLHDCRHEAASHWARAGLGIFELQQVTGHKTTKMLGRYVNLKATTVAGRLAQLSTQQTEGA